MVVNGCHGDGLCYEVSQSKDNRKAGLRDESKSLADSVVEVVRHWVQASVL